jgi:hypothetical protein
VAKEKDERYYELRLRLLWLQKQEKLFRRHIDPCLDIVTSDTWEYQLHEVCSEITEITQELSSYC